MVLASRAKMCGRWRSNCSTRSSVNLRATTPADKMQSNAMDAGGEILVYGLCTCISERRQRGRKVQQKLLRCVPRVGEDGERLNRGVWKRGCSFIWRGSFVLRNEKWVSWQRCRMLKELSRNLKVIHQDETGSDRLEIHSVWYFVCVCY